MRTRSACPHGARLLDAGPPRALENPIRGGFSKEPSFPPPMNPRFLKRTALAVLVIAALCSPILFRHRASAPKRFTGESAPGLPHDISATIPAVPPQQIPPLPQPAVMPVPAPAIRKVEPAPPAPSYAPGHFPGVSVRHVPGTHVPTPPEGTERTVPESREVVLADGRVFIGVTLDETWRVPLKAKVDR